MRELRRAGLRSNFSTWQMRMLTKVRSAAKSADVIVDEDTIERILREDVLKRETLEGPEADSAAKRVARNSERSIVKERESVQPAAKPNPSPAPKTEAPAAPTAAT